MYIEHYQGKKEFRSGGASCVGVEYSPNDVREELRAQACWN